MTFRLVNFESDYDYQEAVSSRLKIRKMLSRLESGIEVICSTSAISPA